ncbi:MAG TPA: YHS domain-containing protein [Thermodesulforhabdus norvegica]|uniref:YHS domain-containing protein n=1 Tax=Thermodesulforhabdus norvegica TaxID=39841 RepID=A0A7C0WRL1_9BACT|nr:YHS domain-containing protein [Deltaproteobacteria bacterium]MBW2069248.1 YHS domain-containing protein [Deltaproteobacteria bacterium]HDL89654.1 YHS domain-containing protein [Thermodesulforhabdus norvegica]
MIRLLVYVFIGYLIYRWWKKGVARKSVQDRKVPPREELEGAELVQDPQCGIYFVKDKAVTARIDGVTYYFCSEDCKEAFIRKRSGSEGA